MLAGCGDEEATETTATTAAATDTTAAPTDTTAAATDTTAASTDTSMAAEPEFYLRWAQFATAVLQDSQPQIQMAENVFKRTNGRVKIELFWSDSLVPMFEALDAVRLGSAEMATFPFGPFGGLDPRFASSEMPLFYNTIEAQIEAQSALMPAYSGVFEEKFNQKALQVRSILPLNVGVKKPVEVLADWDGLPDPDDLARGHRDYRRSLGGVGAPASPLDVYELLQKGTVDATIQSMGKYVEAKLWEVCDYFTDAMFISASAATTINLDVWNKMPKDIQDIISKKPLLPKKQSRQSYCRDVLLRSRSSSARIWTVYNLPAAERAIWQTELKPVVDAMLSYDGRLSATKSRPRLTLPTPSIRIHSNLTSPELIDSCNEVANM